MRKKANVQREIEMVQVERRSCYIISTQHPAQLNIEFCSEPVTKLSSSMCLVEYREADTQRDRIAKAGSKANRMTNENI